MTRISKNTQTISGPDETLAQYAYIIPETEERFGIELEQAAIDRASLKPTPVPKALAVIANAAAKGVEVLPEGTSAIFEVLNHTPFAAVDGYASAAADIARQRAALNAALADENQIPLPYATIPFATLAETCHENLHDIPRVRVFVEGYFKHHRPDIGEYFTTCAGAQSSVTLATPLKRLEYISRLSHLTPLLSILTATTPPFATAKGQSAPNAVRSNIGLERRLHALGDPRNPDHLKNAFPCLGDVTQLNEDQALTFARNANEAGWNNPFWCYYEPADDTPATRLRLFEHGQRKPLSALPPAYHTAENHTLLSKIFGLVALSVVPANDTRGIIRRIEARFFDSGGPDQVELLAALTHALAFDKDFGISCDRFLECCGFTPRTPAASFPLLLQSLQSAALDPYETLADIHYGQTNVATAAHIFAAQVLKPALPRYPAFAGLISICETGLTPALKARQTEEADLATFRERLGHLP